jgi:hypothetical protein
MRKKLVIFMVVIAALMLSSNAFAVLDANTNEGTTAGEAIRLTDGLDPANTLVLNFSPSVNAVYNADSAGTAGDMQWYSGATYHSGGQTFYASSQDSTGVYRQSRESNQAFTDVTIPTSKTMTVDGSDVSAEQYWLDNGWSK